MSDLLIRGLPRKVRLRLERMAKSRNSSLNQIIVEMIVEAVKKIENDEEKRERALAAMKRIDAFREAYYKKYGLQEDSKKIIREMRDNRNK